MILFSKIGQHLRSMESSVSLNDYKLSCELLGHSMDVRAVTEGRECIISGSRDKTIKIWKHQGGQYVEARTLSNHSNYVTSVYYLEEEGWICSGSNDATVCVYGEDDLVPFAVLKGHEANVCAITKGLGPKTLFTGSWDKTGRVWALDGASFATVAVLKGHEAAVWAVATLPGGKYVTGSADKLIFIWNAKGEKEQVLKGHTDCVRGLIGLEDGSIISCSNDASIRYWNPVGECIRELYGHGNYIYTIARNMALGPDILVSGSEDSSIRMWNLKSGSLGDKLDLPAQSVWSIACLRNGDIVTGTSDGVVRVFTRDPARVGNSSLSQSFQLAVETRLLEANQSLGGIKRTELPGPESLLQPGNEGQTKIVRHPDGKVNCYQWSSGQWSLLGEVSGASGGSQQSSGKTLYEGKEYDFVFSVDISDSDPPIKLPYNRGEDPWAAAQNFIHKNNLPQAYLDQIANFIVKNSDTPVIQQGNSGYQDPFTGGSRYIPGSNSNDFVSTGNADPFTGGSSYTTNSNEKNTSTVVGARNKHFPYSSYLTFDNCDPGKVLEKLRDFNAKAAESGSNATEQQLQNVILLAKKDPEIDKQAIDTLTLLLRWPQTILFPVLDVARLAVRNEQIYIILNSSQNFVETLMKNLSSSAANQLMAVRGMANLMKHSSGRQDIYSRVQTIVDTLVDIKKGSPNLEIAIATLYLSLSVTQTQAADGECCRIVTEGILEFLKWCKDLEATYRALQALGNLTCTPFGSQTTAQIISVDYVMDKIREVANHRVNGFEKLSDCANSLLLSF